MTERDGQLGDSAPGEHTARNIIALTSMTFIGAILLLARKNAHDNKNLPPLDQAPESDTVAEA